MTDSSKVLYVPAFDCQGVNVTLLRHSKAVNNVEGWFNTLTHILSMLTKEGVELAEKMRHPWCGVVASSPFQRCIDTAKIVYETDDVTVIEELGEPKFYDQERKPFNLKGVLAYDDMCSKDFFGDALSSDTYGGYVEGTTEGGSPLGAADRPSLGAIGRVEPFADLLARYVTGLQKAVELAKSRNEPNVKIVCHYHTFRILGNLLLGRLPFEPMDVPILATMTVRGTTKVRGYWILSPVANTQVFSIRTSDPKEVEEDPAEAALVANEVVNAIVRESGKKIDCNIVDGYIHACCSKRYCKRPIDVETFNKQMEIAKRFGELVERAYHDMYLLTFGRFVGYTGKPVEDEVLYDSVPNVTAIPGKIYAAWMNGDVVEKYEEDSFSVHTGLAQMGEIIEVAVKNQQATFTALNRRTNVCYTICLTEGRAFA